MIVTMYPEPRARARAIGVYSFTQAAGASIGLIAGGALTQALSWHWTFYVNLPIGVVALVLAVRVVEADRGTGLRAGLDVLGAVLVTAAVMLGVYGISSAAWGALAAAAVLLAAFVVRQAKARTPLLPLRLFRIRAVTGANVVMVLMVAGMLGFQFVTALYLQQVLGLDALRTGVAFLPVPLVIAVASLGFADKLAARFGPRSGPAVRPRPGDRRPAAAHAGVGDVLHRRAAAAAGDGPRRRRGDPGADGAGDVATSRRRTRGSRPA